MKTKIPFLIAVICGVSLTTAIAQNNLIVHEWGTFTDVQGADGGLLSWRPLQTSELPAFVRDWRNPGMNRQFRGYFAVNQPYIGKGNMLTLQRMETPVMYFYSDHDLTADVTVAFPSGLITEWYPQATQIGPSVVADTNAPSSATLPSSQATWKHLSLLAPSQHPEGFRDRLPPATSGSHYFAARATGADTVRTSDADTEYEQFIFYRGAGSFFTPLRVSVNDRGQVVIQNAGTERLNRLFLVEMTNGVGSFTPVETLAAADKETVAEQEVARPVCFSTVAEGQQKLAAAMHDALVEAGLFDDEATAMINTWKDSWFAEDGVRVLFLLPRTWTDETLPLTVEPRPEKTVRVMVGRAEVIMPGTVNELKEQFTRAMAGDAAARTKAVAALKKMGRFADPALQLVLRSRSEDDNRFYGKLWEDIAPPK